MLGVRCVPLSHDNSKGAERGTMSSMGTPFPPKYIKGGKENTTSSTLFLSRDGVDDIDVDSDVYIDAPPDHSKGDETSMRILLMSATILVVKLLNIYDQFIQDSYINGN